MNLDTVRFKMWSTFRKADEFDHWWLMGFCVQNCWAQLC